MKLIFIVIFIILFYLIVKINKLSAEKFDATSDTVTTSYNTDVAAITHLSTITSNLNNTNKFNVPASLNITSNLNSKNTTISSVLQSNSATISGLLESKSNVTISGLLTASSVTISGGLIANSILNTGTTTISGILNTTTINCNNMSISGDVNIVSISGTLNKIILPNNWSITTDISSNIYFNNNNNKRFLINGTTKTNPIIRIGKWNIISKDGLKQLWFQRYDATSKWMAIKSNYSCGTGSN